MTDSTDTGPGRDTPPLCPITGEPAARLIQKIPTKLLKLIWKCVGWTDVSKLFSGVDEVGLWESPCGLAFFFPSIEGDEAFYKSFYGRFKAHERLATVAGERDEFILAAGHVADGAAVLDVGAGGAGFRQHVSQAQFTGLDPYADTQEEGVLPEHAEEHAQRLPEHYDVVTSFQVIEHTIDPLAFAKTLVKMVKPGGTLILGVPLWPSPMVNCPNVPINCPPHHLTWWNEGALTALAGAMNLEVIEIRRAQPHREHAVFCWMDKFTWIDRAGRYFANKLSWHLNFLFALPMAAIAAKFLGLPRSAEPIDILLVARKSS